jgi:hypothetical protein
MLDDAAKTIPVVRVLLDSDVSIQNTLVQYAFHIEGMSAHEVLLHARIAFELTGSFFFDALLKKNALTAASVARLLFRHVSYSKLLVLIASGNVVPALSLLLHALGALNYSFFRPLRDGSDPTSFVPAAVDHVLGIRRLDSSCACHAVALLNQARKVEMIVGPMASSDEAPVDVSVDGSGCMYVCGVTRTSIRVFYADGSFKCDLSIKNADGSDVPSRFLRATAVDWATGNIYVTDRDADIVHCIAPDGRLRASMPAGVCAKPRGLSWCARTRRVAVADYDNHQVFVLDSELNVLATLKGATPADKFQNPIDTGFDANGFLYVLDNRNNRVVVMNDACLHMLTFGSKGQTDGLFEYRERLQPALSFPHQLCDLTPPSPCSHRHLR